MKHYEIVFLVHPDQSEQVSAIVKRCTSIIKKEQGKVHRTEDWGRRQLAYPISKVHKAHYVLMNVECQADVLKEVTEFFRFNEAVLRNLVLAVRQAITKPSPIKLADQQSRKKWQDDKSTHHAVTAAEKEAVEQKQEQDETDEEEF